MFKVKKMKKRIRGSLRGRIIKSMMLLTVITILLLSTMLMSLFFLGVRGIGTFAANTSGREIVEFITSPNVKRFAGIGDMKEMINNAAATNSLISIIEDHNTIDLEVLIDEDRLMEKTNFNRADEMDENGFEIDFGTDPPPDKPENLYLLGLKLIIDDTLVYDNGGCLTEADTWMLRFLDTHTSVPIIDKSSNQLIGRLDVEIHKDLLEMVLWIVFIVFIVLCIICLFIAKLVSFLIVIPAIYPLAKLNERLEQVAGEDIEWAVHKRIEFDKPLKEIAALTNSTNLILEKMRTYSEALEVQKDELEAQNGELEAISSELKHVNRGLNYRNQQMGHILENVRQGFLIIGTDLLVDNEYSAECERIFGMRIGEESFSKLIYSMEPSEAQFMNSVLTKLMNGDDPDLYLPLLPSETQVNDRVVELNYSLIEDRINETLSIMVVISDRTTEMSLQKQMSYEKMKLQMVVKIVSNRDDFVDLLSEYQSFANYGLKELAEANRSCDQKCREIFRVIHTFKGNFSQYDLASTVEHLHFFEDYLSDVLDPEKEVASNVCVAFDSLDLLAWIEEDLNVLTSYLGEDFLDAKSVYKVNQEQIDLIDEKMKNLLAAQDYFQLSPLVKDLKYLNFKKLITGYPNYVNKLAERLEKEVNDMEIEGDDIRVDFDHYAGFTKTLVHIFRNAVDHGLETIEERIEANKSEVGTISCEVIDQTNSIAIEIRDDGRGIQLDAVKSKLLSLGASESEVNGLSRDQLYMKLFDDGFSTKASVTKVSGRGVGMASTKEAVEKLGGRIEVESEMGEGTTFRFILPKPQEDRVVLTTPDAMFEVFAKKTKHHLREITGIDLKMDSKGTMQSKIDLKKYTALVNYHGLRNGLILLSINDALARQLVDGFVMGGYEESEFRELLEDTIAEVSNIIIGNSFEDLGGLGEYITIGTPTMLCYQGATIKYRDAEILTSSVGNEGDGVVLSMVNLDKDLRGEI